MVRSLGASLFVVQLACALLSAPSESISDDVSALIAFKSAVFEDPLSALSDWNATDGHPCGWSGVACSPLHSRVVSLNLSNSSLSGFLASELGFLSSLQELVLDHNAFAGAMPKELGMLKNLTALDLSFNQLAGAMPSEIGGMSKISKIDLRANRLNGTIPLELGNLMNLEELLLSNNSLTGSIPGNNDSNTDQISLCQLTRLTDLDLSYNFLVGGIPACFRGLRRSSFVGNCFQNDDSTNRPVQQCVNGLDASNYSSGVQHEHKNPRQPIWLLILEVVIGVSLVTLLIICVIASIKRRRKARSGSSGVDPPPRAINWKDNTVMISIDDDLLDNVAKIGRQELAEACEDFSNIIGSSADTVVYKGTMKNGKEVAVVSLPVSAHHWTNYLELFFQKEVVELARLNHEHLAKLVGYCRESDPFSRMVVFEYASNGTLHENINDGGGCQLSWHRRMRIALSVARALRYMHTELRPPFAVAELASNAVYLTEEYAPKIMDLNRWRSLLTKPGITSGCIVNGGSFASIADSRHRRFMDVQANTFAFGVILLEIISGRPPSSKDTGDLVDWARKHLDQSEELSKLLDPQLKDVNYEQLCIVCNVVSLCIDAEPARRPSMNMVAAILEQGIDTLKDSSLAWAEIAIS